jgi:hypothetical protein
MCLDHRLLLASGRRTVPGGLPAHRDWWYQGMTCVDCSERELETTANGKRTWALASKTNERSRLILEG